MNDEFNPVSQKTDLQVAAFVFMLVTTIICGIWFVPLAWMLPMTIIYYQKMNRGEEISLNFIILISIFVNAGAGILLLVDRELKKR